MGKERARNSLSHTKVPRIQITEENLNLTEIVDSFGSKLVNFFRNLNRAWD